MSQPPKRKVSERDGELIPSLIPGGKPLFVPTLPKGFDSSKIQFTPTETFPREAQTQDEIKPTGDNQNKTTKTMSKKKSTGGKIAFVDAQLASGKYTKSEIASALSKDFNVPIKTAKNTVSWCASTFGGDRHKDTPLHKKESKHKPEVKGDAKPAKSKAPPKKKSSAPKSKAPKKKVIKSEADNTQVILADPAAI